MASLTWASGLAAARPAAAARRDGAVPRAAYRPLSLRGGRASATYMRKMSRGSSSNVALARCLPPSDAAAGASADPVSESSSKRTIDALSALLGTDAAEEEERLREEEADRARAEMRDRVAAAKAKKEARLAAFRAISTSTLRLQQIQMVFLDMPVLPKFARAAFLARDAAGPAEDVALADLPECEWFDVELPSDAPNRVRAGAAASGTRPPEDSSPAASRTEEVFGEDLTPEYVAYDGEKLPGEFSIPVVPYPFVCLPGSKVRLNLFEPRWLTLFAKLIASRDAADADAAPNENANENAPLVLDGAREDGNRIDLSRNEMCRAYETPPGDDAPRFDVVPGAGRMDERDLVARGVFGALYRRPDGKVAGVGTAMRVAAHDVIIDGKLLSVYGEGDFRFKVLRVRQVNPYLVVDAVPLTDAGSGPEASGPEAAESDPGRIDSRAVANNVVASGLGGGASSGETTEAETPPPREEETDEASSDGEKATSSEDELKSVCASPAASRLVRVVERLIATDPYYCDAVGLTEAWSDTSLPRSIRDMDAFEVANATLYAQPELALKVLATADETRRSAAVEAATAGMEAALAAGITPRRARLLKSLLAFGALFGAGFALALGREFVEATWFR